MAGPPEPAIRPVSRSEMYQYAAAAFRRNFAADPLLVYQEFLRSGRTASEGLFRSQAALAAYNVGREPTQLNYPYEQPLPLEAYRVAPAFSKNEFRVTALADVVMTENEEKQQRAITLTSSRSYSPELWLAIAARIFTFIEEKYRYRVDDINLIDPRRRS